MRDMVLHTLIPNLEEERFLEYGLTKDVLKLRFLRLSAGAVGDKINLGFAPASWNVGKHLPLVSYLWIYGGIARELKTNSWHYFIGLSTIF